MITDFNQLDLTQQYTYADYLTWQFEDRVELIKGWVYKMSPAPLRSHQQILINLANPIINYLEGKTCEVNVAPFDVRLVNKRKSTSNKTILSVVQPDICVVCDPEKLDSKGCIGAPDWIMEIISQSSNKKDSKIKFELYQENGVREYWIVYPAYCEVQVYDLIDDTFCLRSKYFRGDKIPVGIFQGFEIDTDRVFRSIAEED